MDVNRLLRLGQDHAELHLVALVVGQRLHPADGVTARVDVQRLNAVRGVAALVAVAVVEHDEERHRGDDHHGQQPKSCTSRLHREASLVAHGRCAG